MSKVFISHASEDDSFVRELRQSLARHGQDCWVDSRQLRGGDLLSRRYVTNPDMHCAAPQTPGTAPS